VLGKCSESSKAQHHHNGKTMVFRHESSNQMCLYSTLLNISKISTICQVCNLHAAIMIMRETYIKLCPPGLHWTNLNLLVIRMFCAKYHYLQDSGSWEDFLKLLLQIPIQCIKYVPLGGQLWPPGTLFEKVKSPGHKDASCQISMHSGQRFMMRRQSLKVFYFL